MADALKFGPEWLRNLSGGSGGVTSPPTSPAVTGNITLKLSEYRYGQEDMLALYTGDYSVPPELNDIPSVVVQKTMTPLALEDTVEEDSHMYGGSTGMKSLGHIAPIRNLRGSAERGRGRGRGRGMDTAFYQRAYDDDSGFIRKPGRGEGWEEVRDKRYTGGYTRGGYEEEGNVGNHPPGEARKFGRSMSGDSWRGETGEHFIRKPTLFEQPGEGHYKKLGAGDEDGEGGGDDWRRNGGPPQGASTRWNTRGGYSGSGSSNWRDPRQRSEAQERQPHYEEYRSSHYNSRERTYSRSKSGEEPEPEWACDDDEMVGTFDSSGAFMSMKGDYGGKDFEQNGRPKLRGPHAGSKSLEKVPSDRGYVDPGDENQQRRPNSIHMDHSKSSDSLHSSKRAGSEPNHPAMRHEDEQQQQRYDDQHEGSGSGGGGDVHKESVINNNKIAPSNASMATIDSENALSAGVETCGTQPKPTTVQAQQLNSNKHFQHPSHQQPQLGEAGVKPGMHAGGQSQFTGPPAMANASGDPVVIDDKEEDEFDYLEKAAENLVATWTAEDEAKAEASPSPPPKRPPLDENAYKWFYKDPQGEVQGPFKGTEMTEWFTAGYFTSTLLVKRGCDEIYQQLGHLKAKLGKLPFISSEEDQLPPLKAEPTIPDPLPLPTPSVNSNPSASNTQPQNAPQNTTQNPGHEILNMISGQTSQSLHNPLSGVTLPGSLPANPLAGLGMPSSSGLPGLGGMSLPAQPLHSADQLASIAAAAVGNPAAVPAQDPIKLMQEQLRIQQQQYYMAQYQRILQILSQQEGFHKFDKQQQQKLIANLLMKQQTYIVQQQQQQQQNLLQAHQAMAQQAMSTLTPEQQLQLQSQQQGTTLQSGATHHPPGGATLQHPSASRASNMPQVSLPTSTPDPATSVERPEFNRSASHNAAQSGNAANEHGSVWGTSRSQQQPAPPTTSSWTRPMNPGSESVWDMETNKPSSLELQKEEQLKARQLEMENIRRQKEQQEQLRLLQLEAKKEAEMKQREEQKRQEMQRAEMKRREEEARRRHEEEQRLQKEQQERERQQELQRLKEQEEQRIQEELQRKAIEEQKKRREEEIRKAREEAERKLEMERLRQEQEEQARKKREQEEHKRLMREHEAKEKAKRDMILKQQAEKSKQLQNIKLPSTANWATSGGSPQPKSGMTLDEIQHQQRLKARQQEQLYAEQQAALQAAMPKQNTNASWVNNKNGSTAKTFQEIQAEQAYEVAKQEAEWEKSRKLEEKTLAQSAAWGASNRQSQGGNHWGAAWGSTGATGSTGANASAAVPTVGFWDDATPSPQPARKAQKKQKPVQQNNNAQFPSLNLPVGMSQPKPKNAKGSDAAAKKKQEESVHSLFQQAKRPQDEFAQWCEKTLTKMQTSVDIPTFIAFLLEVDSPYEVTDYVRSYLGESKEANYFAKQFLDKRANRHSTEADASWGTVPSKTGKKHTQASHEPEGGKKGSRKKKVKKVDGSSLLSFTVHADSNRVNMGEIDTIE